MYTTLYWNRYKRPKRIGGMVGTSRLELESPQMPAGLADDVIHRRSWNHRQGQQAELESYPAGAGATTGASSPAGDVINARVVVTDGSNRLAGDVSTALT